jgi:hypothetical protein
LGEDSERREERGKEGEGGEEVEGLWWREKEEGGRLWWGFAWGDVGREGEEGEIFACYLADSF